MNTRKLAERTGAVIAWFALPDSHRAEVVSELRAQAAETHGAGMGPQLASAAELLEALEATMVEALQGANLWAGEGSVRELMLMQEAQHAAHLRRVGALTEDEQSVLTHVFELAHELRIDAAARAGTERARREAAAVVVEKIADLYLGQS